MSRAKKVSRKTSADRRIQRILTYYENQTDEEGAKEIESAAEVRDSTWMLVPAELVPQVRKLIARGRKSA
jgi:hypothetical protein